MLFIRRILAVPLSLVFFVCLILVIVIVQAGGKASSPGYITTRLKEADAYNFLYDDVMAAMLSDQIDQGLDFEAEFVGDEPTTIEFDDTEGAKRAIRGFIETVAPREYVQEQVESILDDTMNYAYGRSDEFEISPDLPGRVRSLSPAVRVVAEEIDLGETLTEYVMAPAVRAAAEDFTTDTLGIAFTPDEAVAAAERVVPPAWIERQLFAAVDEMVPYFAGDRPSFAVNVSFQDRVPVVAEILKEELQEEGGTVDLVFDRVVNPVVSQAVGSLTILSYEVAISDDEVNDAVEQVAPRAWIREQADGVIDAAVAYLTGQTETLSYTVDLTERKAAAVRVLGDLAEKKLGGFLGDIPVCSTVAEARQAAADLMGGGLPGCTAEGLDLKPLLDTAVATLRREAADLIGASIPDTLTYTDAEFRDALGGEALDGLEDAREMIRDGFTFTDEDLIEEWTDSTDAEDVERMLEVIRGASVYTHVDFEEDYGELIKDDEAESGEAREVKLGPWTWTAPDLKTTRGQLGQVFDLRWALFIIPLLLLLVIAFLGGQGWYGRLRWAAWVGFVSAAIGAIIFGPVWGSLLSANSENWLSFTLNSEFRADWPATTVLLEGAVIREKIETVLGDMASSLLQLSVVCLIVSLLGLGFSYLWPLRRQPR